MVRLPGKDSTKVFINCPYDKEYEPFFRAIVFGIIANGFKSVCAKEITGGGNRLNKISQMIYDCGYGIHDISRVDIDKNTGFPRFNMAFELGLFIGCQTFGKGNQRDKDFIVLDKNSYRFRNFLSDISGKDPIGHDDKSDLALHYVNEWLGQKRIEKSNDPSDYIGSKSIADFYQEFLNDFPALCTQSKADINNLLHHEYILIASKWLKKKKEMEDKKLEEVVTLVNSVEVKKLAK